MAKKPFDALAWRRQFQSVAGRNLENTMRDTGWSSSIQKECERAFLQLQTEFIEQLLAAADEMQAAVALYQERGSKRDREELDIDANRLRDLLELWNSRALRRPNLTNESPGRREQPKACTG